MDDLDAATSLPSDNSKFRSSAEDSNEAGNHKREKSADSASSTVSFDTWAYVISDSRTVAKAAGDNQKDAARKDKDSSSMK